MNKILLFLIISLTTTNSFAQTGKKQNDIVTAQSTNSVTYRLFPTQNMWTFIKLNTKNGQMWQVQFSMTSDSRIVTTLSSDTLVTTDKEVNDRFTLYPTQNMYTFILLDQLDGKTWQVQWSTEASNRGIMPIE